MAATMNSANRDRRRARAEASVWIVRLHGARRTSELEDGLRRWLQAHPDNAIEFERVTAVWDSAAHANTAGLPRVTRWEKPHPTYRRWAISATCLAILSAAVWINSNLWQQPEYVTGVGEQRTVPLEDGSRIALNSNSRIKVAYTAKRREVSLIEGEVFFEVAHDSERPFVVIAGDQQVTAVGTAFEVRCQPDRIDVTLVEGRVNVTSTPQLLASPDIASNSQNAAKKVSGSGFAMTAGERITIVKGAPPIFDTPRIEAITAWRRGEVMLDDMALVDAVAEMNRYNKSALIIDESRVARLHVSGIYHSGDSEGFAQAVAQLYGLQVIEEGGKIHLRAAVRRDR